MQFSLIISTEFNDGFSVGLADGTALLFYETINKPFSQVELLLKTVNELFGRAKISLQSAVEGRLQRIIVAKGPGDFSALRIGITMANALAYSLSVPVVGVLVSENFENEKQRLEWLLKRGLSARVKKTVNKAFVAPEYGREANVTLKGV